MDLIMGLPAQRGYNAILTIMDHGCSRAAIFLPCADTITRPGIAQLYLDHVYRWFGLPSCMISDRDPRFTSHFGKALTTKLGISRNLSMAFHPQTDGLSKRKNQWVEQYLRLVTLMDPKGWVDWLALATAVHNNQTNVTTGLSPNQILLRYNPILNLEESLRTMNDLIEMQSEAMNQNCKNAIWALNKSSDQNSPPPSQYKPGQQVWLDTTHLKLPYQKAKLTPKRLGPFKITKEISLVAYRLALPTNWRIHNVFHASLLNPYHETNTHGPNFTRPPPDLVEGEEEFEVERIVAHRTFGRSKQSAAKAQSAIKTSYQSTRREQLATRTKGLKETQPTLQKPIECLTIFPTSPSNNSLKTFLLNSSLPSNIPNTTSTPLSLALTASSASGTSSALNMSSNIAGTVNSTTAPFTTATEACPTAPSMPPTSPLTTAHPLPGSLVLVALSPFQSRTYSASPSPSRSTRTTPPLAYPDNSAQATPPTLEPQMCPSNSTSHWGDCHPNQFVTPSQPPTWIHPRSVPLSMPSLKLRTAAISNISTRSGPRTKNTRLRSTSSKKTLSSPSPASSITKRPLSRLQMGMSLTIGSLRSPSPSGRDQTSRPNGSSSLTMGALQDIASTMAQGIFPTSRKSTQPHKTQLLTRLRFFPSGFGRPYRGPLFNTKNSAELYGTSTTGGSMPRCSATTNSTRTSSPSRPSSTSTMPPSPLPRMPNFSPLLSWRWHDFPSRFRIWQPQFGPRPTSQSEEPGRKDTDVHTRAGCDVIDLTNEDSSSDDEEL